MQKLFFKEMNRVKLYLDILRGKKEKTWFTIIRIKREDLDVMDKIFEDTNFLKLTHKK